MARVTASGLERWPTPLLRRPNRLHARQQPVSVGTTQELIQILEWSLSSNQTGSPLAMTRSTSPATTPVKVSGLRGEVQTRAAMAMVTAPGSAILDLEAVRVASGLNFFGVMRRLSARRLVVW